MYVLNRTLLSKDKARCIDYFFAPSVDQCRQLKGNPPHCHSELAEESPASTTHFVREIILSCNLIVSANALLLSFQIPRYARNDKRRVLFPINIFPKPQLPADKPSTASGPPPFTQGRLFVTTKYQSCTRLKLTTLLIRGSLCFTNINDNSTKSLKINVYLTYSL